jgi:hypothetical protein
MGYRPVDRAGSHLKLRYVHPETGEVRNVTIPMGKEISLPIQGSFIGLLMMWKISFAR